MILIDHLKAQGIDWFHWLLIACYATALPTWFLDHADMTRLDWIISDLREYTLIPCLYFTCFVFIPYEHFVWKLLAWLSGWLAIYNLIKYLCWVSYPETYPYLVWTFYPLMALVVYLFLVNRARANRMKSNYKDYNPSKTYIARKRPATARALILAIIYRWPMDTVSVIHCGKWYKMKGRFREVPFDYAKLRGYYLQEIEPDGSFGARLDFLLKKRRPFNLRKWNCYHCAGFLAKI